jgi:Ca2+-binding RTX toxin-like protein
MPATMSVAPSGNAYIDGLLFGRKWAVNNLTFSFPSGSQFYHADYGAGEPFAGFEAFNAVQQAAMRKVLLNYSAVSNLRFSEVTESATTQGDLRFAESDMPATAWAYYPHPSPEGGDAWFNRPSRAFDNPVPGNYAWLTFVHEVGHTVGLKHPHVREGSFGRLPSDHDSLEYTVMSYRSYVGASVTGGYTNGDWDFPQTLMMDDIRALQWMYGANYQTNSTNTTYSWSPTTGEMFINGVGQGRPGGNKIFVTVWDGGGIDTYDFSNYSTNLSVNLQPGAWTTVSTVQLARLDPATGRLAAGNIANAHLFNNNSASLIENAIGGSGHDMIIGNAANNVLWGGPGNDTLWGLAGDDILIGGPGNDFLNGGEGINIAGYSGSSSQYAWFQNGDGSWTVVDNRAGSPEGQDTLINIARLSFTDGLFDLLMAETATPQMVEDAYRGVVRIDVDDQLAIDIAAQINRGEMTFSQFLDQLIAGVKDTTGAALLLYSFIEGVTPTSPELDHLTATARFLIAQANGNPIASWQQMGASLTDSPFSTMYRIEYAHLSDGALIDALHREIFDSAPSAFAQSYFMNLITHYEQYYSFYPHAGDPLGETRARGTLIGDMLKQAMDISFGKYPAAVHAFLHDAADGTAPYGMPLLGVSQDTDPVAGWAVV